MKSVKRVMKSAPSRLLLTLGTGLLLGCLGHALAQSAPTVDAAKQALDKKWQTLKLGDTTERNILFQEVTAGRASGGSYPFQVTVLIRDYGPGYPANQYYGTTCVSRIERGVYTLSPDDFGGWNVEGRMTPSLSEQRCQDNPSTGVSSIPRSSLSGTPSPAGQVPSSARPYVAQAGNGGGAVRQGVYECWSSNRANMTLNFSIGAGNHYAGYNGSPGTFSFDTASQRITFKGGTLDGVMSQGFYSIYYAPQGRPTVSFRDAGGSEVAFCQRQP
jgi:hypothetical protein